MSSDNYRDYNSFVRKVESLIALQDYNKASDLLQIALSEAPLDRGFQRFFVTVLLGLNKFKDAMFWLKKIISTFENSSSPSQVNAFYYKGLFYFLQGNFKRSMKSLSNCFELDISFFKKLLYDKDFDSLRDSAEFERLITPSKEFTVNEYISLRLMFSKTLIYVCNELFLTCQKIAINIAPIEFREYANFNDIDDIIDFYNSHAHSAAKKEVSITPEEEFWGHCSNLQAWVENDYNTCVLSKNISFPLLKELSNRRISRFTQILKKELIERIRMGG